MLQARDLLQHTLNSNNISVMLLAVSCVA